MPSAIAYNVNPTDPAVQLAAVTPSDTVDLSQVARALWVGTAGSVAVIASGDSSAVTLAGVNGGTLLPIRVKRVLSTGTTAGSIVAVY